MPELPEVETIRRDLTRVLVGKTIKQVQVGLPKIVGGKPRAFARDLRGQTFGPIKRRGKLLIFTLREVDYTLLLHLKMTGQLLYVRKQRVTAGGHSWPRIERAPDGALELPNKFTHVTFSLTDGSTLYFNDMRQFGYLKLVDGAGHKAALKRFGVEPLSRAFTLVYLIKMLGRRTTMIKQVLLDQGLLAGLGNIYVDEAVFLAKIKPTRVANALSALEQRRLHQAIVQVLTAAIKHRGTTFNSFKDAAGRAGSYGQRLKVYGRAGEKCQRCKRGVIAKIKVGGRGTHFCPECQV